MKKSILVSLLALIFSSALFAQLTGVKSIPGDYPTIQAAIAALNSSGVGNGGVTFNVAAGHTETFTSPTAGRINITSGAESRPVVFQKAGSGDNPIITASTGTGDKDAIITFQGADYVTFDGINLTENPANTNTLTMMEWGYAVLKTSPTNGSQNITIKNCTIFLNRNNTVSVGIYSNNHTVSSFTEIPVSNASGTNSGLKVSGCTISNSYTGIYVSGANLQSYYDQNVHIGENGGNFITNVGGSMNIGYGIFVRRANNLKVANNTVMSNTVVRDQSGYLYLYGIMLTDATNANFDLYNNTVSISFQPDDPFGNYAFVSIQSDMGANGTTNTANIYNNTVNECSLSSFKGSSEVKFMNFLYMGATANVYGNVVSNNTVGGMPNAVPEGPIRYIWVQKESTTPGQLTVHSNSITGNSRIQQEPSQGVTHLLGIGGNGTVVNAYNNIIDNNRIGSNGATYGVFFTFNASESRNLYDCQLTNLTEVNGSFNGIYLSSGGASTLIHRNKIQNVSSNNTAQYASYNGIYVGQLQSHINVYNNFISDLRNPAANATEGYSWNILNGIYVESNQFSKRFYNNTIYLDVTPTGTQSNYGSSAITAESLYGLDLLNNIFINISGSIGSNGKTAAIRSRNTNTSVFTSNYNNLYAGAPGANRLIFFNGTTAIQTLTDYKIFISPQEEQSVTELSPFVNVSTRPYDLHLKTNVPTQCESGGVTISSPIAVTVDIDGQSRYPNPGYPVNIFYTPKAPDIGADEFGGVPSDLIPPSISFIPLPNSSDGQPKTLVVGITDGSGVPKTGIGLARLFWKINNGTYQAVNANWVSDTTYTFTFGGGTVLGDVVSYYFVAQDLANPVNVGATPWQGAAGFTINPPACSTPPSAPFTFMHVQTISGVFHVGVGKNYTTLTAAFNDLNTKYWNGPVTLILDDATYPNETYPLTLLPNPGNNATNSLTIKPNSGINPKFTGNVISQPLFQFRGLDYVTLDGSNNGSTSRNLTFENTSGTDLSSVIGIGNSTVYNPSTNITIKNCIIVGNNTDVIRETYLLVFNNNGGPNGGGYNNIVLDNNWFKRAKNGLDITAAATNKNNNLSIINNTIGSAVPADFVTRWGIAVTQTNTVLISGNEIMGAAGGIDTYSQFGILVYENHSNVKITNNVIHDWISNGPGSQGIRYDNDNNETVAEISNNVIYNIGAWGLNPGPAFTQAHGILIRRGGNIRIWHNSIHLSGPYLYGFDSYAPSSGCIVFWHETFVNSNNFDVRNNILRNSMTNDAPNPAPEAWGKAYGIMFKNTISGLYTENNVYYIDGYRGQVAQQYCVGGACLIDYTTLNDWRAYTGFDANSTDLNPQFTSATNLVPTNPAIDNMGVYIPQVPNDITGAIRSNPPDMGAYEFGTQPLSHLISIPAGWSGISSYLQPTNPTMNSVLAPIMNDLSILYNFNGIYYPNGGIYTLNQWSSQYGYAIKVNQNTTLPVGNIEITDKTVNLNQGWNMIPVLSTANYSISSLFNGVVGFIMAKDIAGTGVYWPAYGINTIGSVQPGKAYYVNMNNAGSINYASLKSGDEPLGFTTNTSVMSPWNEIIATPASHLVLFNLSQSAIETGDIIGGFIPDGACAGVVEVDNPLTPFTLILNGDDSGSELKEGFVAGNTLSYKLYRPSTGETFDLMVSYDNGADAALFEPNGVSVAVSVQMMATGLIDPAISHIRIYPNPSNGKFSIEGIDENVSLTIYNTFGEEIYSSGKSAISSVDLSSQPKGVYVARFQSGSSVKFEKFVIQ